MKWKLLQSNFITAVFFLFLGSVLFAGTTGKIAGFVVDKESGEPLPGVNIILEGTFLGASTDLDGQYAIINIPPGTYTVRAEFVGYESQVVRDVNISIDLTTRIDFSLNPTFVQGEVIEIEAKKEIIQKDLTGTMSTVQSEDIDAMPVQSIDQVINLQAGVISSEDGIHIRGGRGRETKYLVDGISV
ncbi:MAG TPA: TonB-dependent receptor, partial [Caldithrix abyssi]|nr:TonB-dependent receptor [Caldithrix abyssi]